MNILAKLGIRKTPSANLDVAAGPSQGSTVVIDGSTTDNVPLRVTGAGPGNVVKFSVYNSGAASTSNSARFSMDSNTDTSVRSSFDFRCQFSNITDGTRTSQVLMLTAENGTFDNALVIDGHNVGIGSTTTIGARLQVSQETLGSEVFRLQSTATNSDPSMRVFQQRAATTDATPTVIHTLDISSLIGSASFAGFEVVVTARRTGGTAGTSGDGAHYRIRGAVKNVAGTTTIVGANVTEAFESQAAWDATVTATGSTIVVTVTGATNNNITWHSHAVLYGLAT